jgi:tetratricopeptide (TPR) repeat protein
MSTISIREQQKTETGFQARLSFNGGMEYDIEVSDPFPPEQETELEWYFERWLVFPLTDKVRAERARESVRSYGVSLFEQVFKQNVDAYSDYKAIGDAITQIEIIGKSPEFQALHWEALHDPQMPRPLAVDAVMVRQWVNQTVAKATIAAAPVIRLLVVTARPGEEHDVNHRTISRPLMELIQQSQLRVQVDLLRPATFEALTQHLDEKGAGYYHIVHLDMHGAVMSYEEVQALCEREQKATAVNRLTFREFGEELQPFEGLRALLSLESGMPGQSDLREAAELAGLLTGKQIPVCILNACQSAKQIRGDERETSLGAALMAAGMQTVLAMGYSVTVSAAEILMKTLYEQLFAGKTLDEAIRFGRKALHDRQERKAYFNQTIRLEDWLLPVVYRRGRVNLALRDFTPHEEETYWQQQASLYRLKEQPKAPTYGFVGRDLEILKIERALLRQNVLLVQGMGGTGKTTLLNYLREWWQTTQFVKDVFYFGYDQQAYTLEQILFAIGQRVYDKYAAAQFQAMPLAAQVAKLVATLKAEPYALMLDNLESVTGQALAIQNTLNPEEQAKLRDFLQRLVDGKTKVVLGSRSREPWLDGVLRGAVYELRGLDEESRTTLAEQILARQVQEHSKIERIRQSDDFKKLMKLLAGYPLAMEVVLGNLRRQSAAEILAGLDAADVKLDSGSTDKTASILKCVEYSHSNLSADAQKLLVCLAPLSGFIDRTDLPRYAEQLRAVDPPQPPLIKGAQEQDSEVSLIEGNLGGSPFKDYPFEQFDSAIQEAIDWGLLSPKNADNPHLLTIQPVFPYFLKTKLNQLNAATREALFEGFKNHYRNLARYYQRLMDSKEPQERQTGILFCQWEYENLYNALKICLEKQESISILFCLTDYFKSQQDYKSYLGMTEKVCQSLEQYPADFLSSENGYQIPFAFHRLANAYLETKQYSLEKSFYQKALETYDQLNLDEERQKKLWQATAYHQLGRVAQAMREYEQARQHYQQALQIKIEYNDRYSQASTHHNLGVVAQELREYEAAREYYQQALQIKIEYNDRYSQAGTYHNLGMVTEELREYEAAREYYQQALQIFIEYNDRYSQASTYHELGRVAQAMQEYEAAREYYQQALQIKIEYNDRYSQASTYHQLGRVAEELREYEAAREYYQQALQIKIEYNDRYTQARTYHQLGRVAQAMQEYEAAREYYQQALQIFIEYNDRYSQASTYHNLGIVAQELREFQQAREYYQQALQIYIEFNDRYEQASTYYQLAKIAEELGDLEAAKANYLQDLQITAEFNDQHGLGISLRNLARFYKQTQDEAFLATVASLIGTTLEDLKSVILSV